MKKRVLMVVAAIAMILSIYAIYAGTTVNGAEIYLVSYETGKVFAATYFAVGAAASVCWIVFFVLLVKKLKQWKSSGGIQRNSAKVKLQERIVNNQEEKENVQQEAVLKTELQEEEEKNAQETVEPEAAEIVESEIEKQETEETQNVLDSDEKKCAGCGALLSTSAKFCTHCGRKVD